MGVLSNTLARQLDELKRSDTKLIASYEAYIVELQNEIKRLKGEEV